MEVLVERRGPVGLVTLNRPEKLNALNTALVTQLEQALRELDADDAVGAIVVTGAGERAFSAGGDMSEQIASLEADTQAVVRVSASSLVREVRKPTIAAIRGYCFGGGALMAIEFDIRIAAEDARFKFHGASYGRAPGGAVLPRIIGDAKAKETFSVIPVQAVRRSEPQESVPILQQPVHRGAEALIGAVMLEAVALCKGCLAGQQTKRASGAKAR